VRNAASAVLRTAADPADDSSITLPLAKTVRTAMNPAPVSESATSVIVRLIPPTLTPRRNAG
jgi:hypothetical protein